MPVILPTAPSSQRFPRKIFRLPDFWIHLDTYPLRTGLSEGLSKGRITLCAPKSRSDTLLRFCARLCPVT